MANIFVFSMPNFRPIYFLNLMVAPQHLTVSFMIINNDQFKM